MLSMIRRGGLPWVLGVLILGGAGLAKAASEIGGVVYLQGRAAAVDGTGARRLLREGARFEAGETLRTLAGSELRLRFDDGALLTLAESSALNLQAYSEVAGVSSLRRSSSRAAFAPRPVQLLARRPVPTGWPHLSRCSGFEARIMPLAWLKSRVHRKLSRGSRKDSSPWKKAQALSP